MKRRTQNGQNGKGDTSRVSDLDAYRDGYEAIFGDKGPGDSGGNEDQDGLDSGGE